MKRSTVIVDSMLMASIVEGTLFNIPGVAGLALSISWAFIVMLNIWWIPKCAVYLQKYKPPYNYDAWYFIQGVIYVVLLYMSEHWITAVFLSLGILGYYLCKDFGVEEY